MYALASTPKVLKNTDPEIIYEKIENICYDAANRGAKIIGLGAYTKIVGDQGITINQNSPIPVTTGNSLSASATLWALYDVVKKMGLLKKILTRDSLMEWLWSSVPQDRLDKCRRSFCRW